MMHHHPSSRTQDESHALSTAPCTGQHLCQARGNVCAYLLPGFLARSRLSSYVLYSKAHTAIPLTLISMWLSHAQGKETE